MRRKNGAENRSHDADRISEQPGGEVGVSEQGRADGRDREHRAGGRADDQPDDVGTTEADKA
jgi:hypothetical protein